MHRSLSVPPITKMGKAGFLPNTDLVAISKIIGRIGFLQDIDPRMPVSYGYELAPEYRDKKNEQRLVFGDVIPLVRCLASRE